MDLLAAWPTEGGLERFEALSAELVTTEAPPLLRAHLDWQVAARLRNGGDPAATREFLRRRARLYTSPNDALANLVRMEANLAREDGDWSAAEALLTEAHAALSPIDGSSGPYTFQAHAAWHDVRFALFNDMGMLDAAADELREQSSFAERSKDPVAIDNAFMNRATLAVSREDWDALDEMVADADAGRIVLDARERARLELRSAVCSAEAEREGRRPRGRCEAALRALVARESTPTDVALEARANLALILFDDGRTQESRAELEAADAAYARAGGAAALFRGLALPLAALRARLALSEGDRSPAADDLRAQRTRLRELFSDQLARWRRAPNEQSGIGYLHFGDSYLLANELMRLELALARFEPEGARRLTDDAAVEAAERRAARDALAIPLQLHSVGSLSRDATMRDLDVDEVARTLVAPGLGYLLYFPGRAHALVFALDESGVHAWELASWLKIELARRELQSAVLQAARSGRAEDEDRARGSAATLSRQLFPPELARRVAGWRSVCLLGTDLTGWVPFELLKPTESAEELGRSHGVSYLPSLPWGVYLDARPTAPPESGAPVFALFTGDGLPDVVRDRWHVTDFEASVTDTIVDGWGSTARRHTHASLELLRASITGARVTQIVAHGVYDSKRRRPGGLLFSTPTGGVHEAWAEDLESVSWPEVVVLTSCGAQRTQLRRGDDGRASLAGALLAGGARCVALSYADVELHASVAVSRAFGAGLRAGLAPDEAMRRARSAPGVGFQGCLVHLVGRADRPIAVATTRVLDTEARGRRDDPARGDGDDAFPPIVLAIGVAALGVVVGLGLVLRRRA